MSESDWYTRESWSEEDAEDFWSRISRKRDPRMKSQLIGVQAEHLEKSGYVNEALSLLNTILSEYSDTFDLAQVYNQLATCNIKQGNNEQSIQALRKALELERETPNYLTGSWLTFGVLITENKLTDYYSEFLDLVEYVKSTKLGLESRLRLQNEQYYFYGTLANINAYLGNKDISKECAQKALDAAESTESGYRYHPDFCLVKEKDTHFYKSLLAISKKRLTSQLTSRLWRRTH